MREIKFRGKRIDNGEWAYGYYAVHKMMVTGEMDYFIIVYEQRPQSINPETVGQYTGLKDRNDAEIYEGDIVACDSNGVNRYEYRVICYDLYQTKYKAVPLSTFHLNAGNGGWTGYDLKYHNEVIGNIYDNPELLSKEDES